MEDYKRIATAAQILGESQSLEKRIELESIFINETMMGDSQDELAGVEHKNLVYSIAVRKFNEKYSGLLSEQRKLLEHFIYSSGGEGLDYKAFLDRELGRVKDVLRESLSQCSILGCDPFMQENTQHVLDRLNEISKSPITESELTFIMKTQELVKEIQSDDQ